MEQTVAIIKPFAYQQGHTGKIINEIEAAGFTIRMMDMTEFSREDACYFYEMHEERSFFGELVDYMSSGPIVVMVLEKQNAIEDFRKLIGATDPANASPDSIRGKYGTSVDKNAIHGSDSTENALREMTFIISRQQKCMGGCQCRG